MFEPLKSSCSDEVMSDRATTNRAYAQIYDALGAKEEWITKSHHILLVTRAQATILRNLVLVVGKKHLPFVHSQLTRVMGVEGGHDVHTGWILPSPYLSIYLSS